MINVSFNDLMVGNELPAPRTPNRSDAPAFAALLDHGAASHDAAASDSQRDTDGHDTRTSTKSTTEIDWSKNRTVAEQPTRSVTETRSPAEHHTSVETRSPDMPDAASSETVSQASAGTESETPAGTAKDSDAGATDAARADQTVAAVAIFPMPAAPLAADIAPLVAPGLAPQNFSNASQPVVQDAAVLPELQAGQSASAPTEPKAPPQFGDDVQTMVAAAETITGDAPLTAPVSAGKSFSETLFATTLLAQLGAADEIVLPIAIKPQTASVTSSLTAAPSADRPIAGEPSLDSAATLDQAPPGNPASPAIARHTAAVQSSQQATQLSTLLDLQNVDINILKADIIPLGESASAKPTPALANGMVAQIGLLQPADKSASPSAPTGGFGPADVFSAAGNAPVQTAAAIAAPAVAQAVADESRPQVAPDQDGMVLNAPAPTGAAHISQNAAVDHASPAKFTLPTQPATEQVAVHIAKAAAEGTDKINIKLKPISLGQIEVQLDVASDGRVHAVIAADKPETLDLLQRDARGLERALNDAGLRTDSGSLSFNLRSQNQPFGSMGGNAGSGGGFGAAADRVAPDMELLGNASRIGAYLNARAATGGVDIQV